MHTDASKYGYEAILLQESEDGQYHPIYYMSKKTLPHEEKYSSYELEMLAVIEAPTKFRHFLQAIKRTQLGTGLKLRPKFYGPYRIKTVKPHDRYEVEKVSQHEGPHLASTAVDFMKKWSTADA
ncbi:putative blastopia polyprotein [Trichonephila clavipes]|nr:putative blastopia polyprotein [Trichonephila clavipes]